MYYVYLQPDESPCIKEKPHDMPLIKISKSRKNAEKALVNFVLYGRNYLAHPSGGKENPLHYGIVVGRYDKETLKCIECVEYKESFNKFQYCLDNCFSEAIVSALVCKRIFSDEVNADVLSEETNNFQSMDTGIWWNDDMRHI